MVWFVWLCPSDVNSTASFYLGICLFYNEMIRQDSSCSIRQASWGQFLKEEFRTELTRSPKPPWKAVAGLNTSHSDLRPIWRRKGVPGRLILASQLTFEDWLPNIQTLRMDYLLKKKECLRTRHIKLANTEDYVGTSSNSTGPKACRFSATCSRQINSRSARLQLTLRLTWTKSCWIGF